MRKVIQVEGGIVTGDLVYTEAIFFFFHFCQVMLKLFRVYNILTGCWKEGGAPLSSWANRVKDLFSSFRRGQTDRQKLQLQKKKNRGKLLGSSRSWKMKEKNMPATMPALLHVGLSFAPIRPTHPFVSFPRCSHMLRRPALVLYCITHNCAPLNQ